MSQRCQRFFACQHKVLCHRHFDTKKSQTKADASVWDSFISIRIMVNDLDVELHIRMRSYPIKKFIVTDRTVSHAKTNACYFFVGTLDPNPVNF